MPTVSRICFNVETPPSHQLVQIHTIHSDFSMTFRNDWANQVNTNHQRVGAALKLFSVGIYPFFEYSLRNIYGERWEESARASCRSQSNLQANAFRWDAQAILTVMWDHWNTAFRKSLGIIERSAVSELREFRNRWAHQSTLDEDDTFRVLDSVQRLLAASGIEKEAAHVEELKIEVLREKLGRRLNAELAHSRFNRSRMIDSSIYAGCAIAICSMMIAMWGGRHPLSVGFTVGFTSFVFIYLIYKRFRANPPTYGVHECGQCGKVIYTEVCPYCDRNSSNGPQTQQSFSVFDPERSGFVQMPSRQPAAGN